MRRIYTRGAQADIKVDKDVVAEDQTRPSENGINRWWQGRVGLILAVVEVVVWQGIAR
jgi:hypothetical protein